jgi:hypothetical protein
LDRFTFIAEMTKALAWPVVTVVVALLARKPVKLLIEGVRLQKLKVAGWEAEFGKLEAKVQEQVAELPVAAAANSTPSVTASMTSADADALAIIVGNWVELERRVLGAARERFGDQAEKHFPQALNQLLQEHVVSAATVEALRGLQAMRNLAVHAPDEKTLAGRVPHFTSLAQAMRFTLDHELKRSGKP